MADAGDSDVIYSTSTNGKDHTWVALVELARAIVQFADKEGGEHCDHANVYVSKWHDAIVMPAQPDSGDLRVPRRWVDITITMPSRLVDAALERVGILQREETDLEKAQRIRFSLLEME